MLFVGIIKNVVLFVYMYHLPYDKKQLFANSISNVLTMPPIDLYKSYNKRKIYVI